MTIEVAQQITGRIWCDPVLAGEVIDTKLAAEIAQLLTKVNLDPITEAAMRRFGDVL